jgi:hypothetical protein
MEPRSFRVGSDGTIHSARDTFAANPLHNLSYAQNVGYALPGFKPTISSSESVGQDSILKGWQYLSASGVSSLNVSNAGSVPATAFVGAASAFPGLNHRISSATVTAATTAGVSAAAASAAAAAAASTAFKSHAHSRPAFALESISRPSFGPSVDPLSDTLKRSNATQFRLSSDAATYLQHQQNPLPHHDPMADTPSSRAAAHVLRAAVTAPPLSKPWADLVPGSDLGAAAANAASFQLQHTLVASQQSNIRRATGPNSDLLTSSRTGDSSDRVRSSFISCLHLMHF